MSQPKYYGLNELREMFLHFFETKGHLRLPSFSLIPQNDASLLLINSGMAPMKPFFTGEQEPPRHRVTTCQKCIRTGDIENIGHTARHGTYFEMLGNFSFGDYFKTGGHPLGVGVPDEPRVGGPGAEPAVSLRVRRQRDHPRRRRGVPHLARGDRHPRGPHLQVRQGGQLLGARLRPVRPLLRDLLRPGPRVGLRQARLHRGLRLRPLYGGLERRVLPVRQRRRGPLHRAQAEEHRHRHGPGALGRCVPGRGFAVRRGHGDEHHEQGHGDHRRRATARAARKTCPCGSSPTTSARLPL